MHTYTAIHIHIYIYIHSLCLETHAHQHGQMLEVPRPAKVFQVRPVHLLRVSLLRVLESNFPGDSLPNYIGVVISTS